MCQFQYLFGNFNPHSNDDTAYILLNRLQMVFFTITHDDHIIFFYIFFHLIRIGSCYHNLSLDKISMCITFDHFSSNCLSDSLILRSRSGKKITVCCIHICFCNITNCDQAFQCAVFFTNRQRNDAVFLHQIPCIFQ